MMLFLPVNILGGLEMKIKSFFQKKVFKKKNIPYFLIFLVLIAGIVFLVFRKKVDEYVVEDHINIF